MRAWLISAVVLAGCLHGPAFPAPSPHVDAMKAWHAAMQAKEYLNAAEAAAKGGLHPRLIGLPLELARQEAQASAQAYLDARWKNEGNALRERMVEAFRQEVAIACTYGPVKESAELAVNDVRSTSQNVFDDGLLNLLLENSCPLDHDLRYEIIMTAAASGLDDLALKEALHAPDWTDINALTFAIWYPMHGNCGRGFRIATLFALKPDAIEKLIAASDCEPGGYATAGWAFPRQDARGYFFAAVRQRKYRLALAFNRLAGGGDEEIAYLVQELFAHKDEYAAAERLVKANPELRDPIYAFALAHGRARYVGQRAKEISWEERAFEQLLRDGKYEDAAEVAEYGVSLTLRTEGVLRAFRAAAQAGNFPSAGYLGKRYSAIVPKDEVEAARDAWNAAHPDQWYGPRKLPRNLPKLPPCSKDWDAEQKPCQK